MNTKVAGRVGEIIACNYLVKRGYDVKYRNWYCHWGELDIVAEKDRRLIFVEVKMRNSDAKGFAYESMSYKKKLHLMRSIRFYLAEKSYPAKSWQLDLVCIDREHDCYKLTHYTDVIN